MGLIARRDLLIFPLVDEGTIYPIIPILPITPILSDICNLRSI